ncbi:MAG: hypothetical protein JO295_03715 [Verrucomicrobia bacterium]|nr:hypothetical protein [Verrucomicrobiota bacterium]
MTPALASGMSWQKARDEAQRWLDTMQLPKDLSGRTLDLRESAKALRFSGRFREMVLEAARRALVKRKAAEVILEDEAQ